MIRILFSLALAVALAACQTVTPRTWELPPGVKTLEVNGYELAYLEKGVGVPLVLLHGTAVDYRYFTASMDALAVGHRVIAVSLRHHYPERWDGKGDYNLPLLASDVAEFIRKLNAGPVHLVGHSYGGTVAMLVARSSPQLLRSVVSVEGMGHASNLAPTLTTEEAAARAQMLRQREAMFERGDVDAALKDFVARTGAAWDRLPEATRQSLRDNAWVLYAGDKAGRVEVPCEELRRLPIPALLIQGEKTTPFYVTTSDNLARCLSRVERATVAGAPHAAPRTHPAEFAKVVHDFVARQ
jgi:esterase